MLDESSPTAILWWARLRVFWFSELASASAAASGVLVLVLVVVVVVVVMVRLLAEHKLLRKMMTPAHHYEVGECPVVLFPSSD